MLNNTPKLIVIFLAGLLAVYGLYLRFFFHLPNKQESKLPITSVITATPTPEPSNDIWRSCTSHSDCISIRADSCGCSAGGKATAINKRFAEEWEQDHPVRTCPAVMSADQTCIGVSPRCINNKCQLVNNN
jgi:hypothetical protein